MTEKSALAAVAAAAAGPAAASKPEPMTADRIKAEHPSVYAEIFNAGAQAEHDRIAGIEKAAMPGHDAIIAAHKADRSKTPAQAAFAVIEAEKAGRAGVKAALEQDEQKAKVIKSTAVAAASGDGDTSASKIGAAAAIGEKAKAFKAEMAEKGINISIAEAVDRVTTKEG